jgi:hypothetical protein
LIDNHVSFFPGQEMLILRESKHTWAALLAIGSSGGHGEGKVRVDNTMDERETSNGLFEMARLVDVEPKALRN